MQDIEARISERAEELALQRTGRQFGDLSSHMQMLVWMDAEQQVYGDQVDEIEARISNR